MATDPRAIYLLKLARRTLTESPKNFRLSIDFCKKFLNFIQSRQYRLSSELRAMICRKCCLIQVPGLSCSIRHSGRRYKHLTVSCLHCGMVKRFRTDLPAFSRRLFASARQSPSACTAPVQSTGIKKPHIVLFKSETEPDEYRLALDACGFAVSRIPMQRMVFVNEAELENILFGEMTADFRSILVSSVNAVRAIERLTDSDSLGTKIHKFWSTRSCLTVGKKTRSGLERLGFRVQQTFADGADASQKMPAIFSDKSLSPLLYLTGDGTGSNKEADVVAEKMEEMGISFRAQTVFTVQANSQLREEYDRACREFGRPEVIVFFSPQTTAFIAEQISLNESSVDAKSMLICVGEATAAVLRSINLTPAAAVQPNVKNIIAELVAKFPHITVK